MYDIIPQTVESGDVTGVLFQGRHVRHTAVQIHTADGMSGYIAHLPYGFVVLVIDRIPVALASFRTVAMPSFLQEPVREIEVFLLMGDLI